MNVFPPVFASGMTIPSKILLDAQKECPPNGRIFIQFMSVSFIEADLQDFDS